MTRTADAARRLRHRQPRDDAPGEAAARDDPGAVDGELDDDIARHVFGAAIDHPVLGRGEVALAEVVAAARLFAMRSEKSRNALFAGKCCSPPCGLWDEA